MRKIYKKNEKKYMSIIEHLDELRERIITSIIFFSITSFIFLIYTKQITFILQKPAIGIKFFQLAPGEYLFVSAKISLYCALIINFPIIIYQILEFVRPGLTKQETMYVIPITISSIILFFLGIIFSYQLLIPLTLNFLINYGSEIIEPIWSFDEYFNFILSIILSTGICFQMPIIQVLLGLNNVIQYKEMLQKWKYIAFTASIIGAIITPSTDPITQTCLTITILILYFTGIIILKIIKK
uniref:Sec-independent protein translocase component TatC n=1 Tax=Polysiphonia sp. TaxID=1967842 RepID=A0A1Z1MTB9_9FLOR|nr:Sec-independent protein translocase component TatC [Polysiphonia sp.]